MAKNGESNMVVATFNAMKSVDFLRLSQLITQIFLFIIPALLYAYLFNKDGIRHLKISRLPDMRFLILSVLLIIVIQPLISFTGYYNAKMQLPEFMSGIEDFFQKYEVQTKLIMDQLLQDTSTFGLISNLFIIAIMAGISEEFIFRGALQQIFKKITSNYHLAVWISAFIFSAIHMQFYGFVPRMLLGAVLGYMFVWSGSLWLPIIIHALYNGFIVLMYRFYHGTPQFEKYDNIGVGDMWWSTLVSIVLTVLISVGMKRMYDQKVLFNNDI